MLSSPPSIGFGFWKVDNDQAAEVAYSAIRSGYRHLDNASDYGNEAEVGQGISRALVDDLCKRDELWITSKLWNTNHRPEHVEMAARRSLADLRVDYLDLYLIHFPISLKHVPFDKRYPAGWVYDPESNSPQMEYDPVPIIETWRAMESLVDNGLVKQIGISNFNTSLIRDLLTQCRIRPSNLQIESHPYLTQDKLLRFCQSESISVTAFSPLGAPSYIPLGMAEPSDSVLSNPTVAQIAQDTGKTPAQVILKWGCQRGTSVIPKSNSPARQSENLNIADFTLTPQQMADISELNRNQRFNDPGVFAEAAFNTFFPIYE